MPISDNRSNYYDYRPIDMGGQTNRRKGSKRLLAGAGYSRNCNSHSPLTVRKEEFQTCAKSSLENYSRLIRRWETASGKPVMVYTFTLRNFLRISDTNLANSVTISGCMRHWTTKFAKSFTSGITAVSPCTSPQFSPKIMPWRYAPVHSQNSDQMQI